MLNCRLLFKFLGYVCAGMGLLMIPSLGWSVYYSEPAAERGIIASIVFCLALGGLLILAGRNATARLLQREALALVSLTWVLASVLGALPFYFSNVLGFVDGVFESTSGFSTTGSSVMTAVEAAPKGIVFWRSFTHWLGGAGIIVLFIAVLPYLGSGGKLLFKSESSGPNKGGFTPRIKDTASIVWSIYVGLTILQTIALMLAGMNLFESLCHSFGTLSSGGFSTRQLSILAYHSLPIEIITMVFMICAGTSFGMFYAMAKGNWRAPLKDSEWKTFMVILVVLTLLISFNLCGMAGTFQSDNGAIERGTQYPFWTALRYASFQVVTCITNTGFISADFDKWPEFSRMLLIGIMFLGGCAGSTTAGLKIVRVMIIAKMIRARLVGTFRPRTVSAVRIGDVVVDDEMQRNVCLFAILLFVVFIGGSLLLGLMGVPFTTAISATACTLNGTGPGLEYVGAVRDFHEIPDAGKLVLSLCMVLGRLELFTLLVLFVPSFWRSH